MNECIKVENIPIDYTMTAQETGKNKKIYRFRFLLYKFIITLQ